MINELRELTSIDITNHDTSLWVFKKTQTSGIERAKFSTYFVDTDLAFKNEMKNIFNNTIKNYIEISPYGVLTQPNENEVLTLDSGTTIFPELQELVDRPEGENKARTLKQLENATGYIVIFTNDNEKIYCIKKCSTNWKTVKKKSFINLSFSDETLTIEDQPAFTMEKYFDFYCYKNNLYIPIKSAFESIVSYKDSYINALAEISAEPQFLEIFENLQPLLDHIGNNSIQLRRAAVIQRKGLYRNPDFMKNLIETSNNKNWGITFSENSKILATQESSRVIMQVLLDHRLYSLISKTDYDVPDAKPV
ncbi:Kiwa anti-phage protein KwaB-like domain-containing protein [Pseudomonas sp.]|uniref:Kiwa anti-phage protein KwaB-like domain-containing protein n=1 Tax=Pseudomonas sp. TaxID=306 RepID=UPI00260ABAC8|nr:Kiwa anti-phage protein KwaB-like domain-containing protein [Pseudomonas sp.]